jgi:hypothetical protein
MIRMYLLLTAWRSLSTTGLVHLHFDCSPSLEVKCGIFHLWCHVSAQNILDFGPFWILDFQVWECSTCRPRPAVVYNFSYMTPEAFPFCYTLLVSCFLDPSWTSFQLFWQDAPCHPFHAVRVQTRTERGVSHCLPVMGSYFTSSKAFISQPYRVVSLRSSPMALIHFLFCFVWDKLPLTWDPPATASQVPRL